MPEARRNFFTRRGRWFLIPAETDFLLFCAAFAVPGFAGPLALAPVAASAKSDSVGFFIELVQQTVPAMIVKIPAVWEQPRAICCYSDLYDPRHI